MAVMESGPNNAFGIMVNQIDLPKIVMRCCAPVPMSGIPDQSNVRWGAKDSWMLRDTGIASESRRRAQSCGAC
jgi:hypothetical protein